MEDVANFIRKYLKLIDKCHRLQDLCYFKGYIHEFIFKMEEIAIFIRKYLKLI